MPVQSAFCFVHWCRFCLYLWCPGHRGYLSSPHSALHLGCSSCLSETHKHKYKSYYFSMIPPPPKHAVLLSRGLSFGDSLCVSGQDENLQRLQLVSNSVTHCRANMGFQTCPCLHVPCNQHCSSAAEPPPSGIPQGASLVFRGAAGSDCPLTWAIAEAWWVLMTNTELLSCHLYKCHL